MPVFKAYFKVIKQNLAGTIIYFAVFLAISILVSSSLTNADMNKDFQDVSLRIAVVNLDDVTVLTNAIEELLAKNNEIITVEASEEAIREELFYRNVEYAVIIPKGFTKSYLNNQGLNIQSYRVPDSYSSIYLDMKLNQFLNTVRVYDLFNNQEFNKNIEMAMRQVMQDTTVNLESKKMTSEKKGIDIFSMYTSYVIISAILFCVTTFMVLFNHSEVRQRTDVSVMKPLTVEMQIILANIVMGIITVLVLIITAMIMYADDALTISSLLYYGLMFTYALMSIAMAFLLSNFAKQKHVLSALVTTISLVFAFLGGTFIPLSLQSEQVRFVGSFTPAYWFSQTCDYIFMLEDYKFSSLVPYFQNLGLIILFAIAFLAMGLLVRKTKKLQLM